MREDALERSVDFPLPASPMKGEVWAGGSCEVVPHELGGTLPFMVRGGEACRRAMVERAAPSTTLRVVPLPRVAGEDS